MKNTRGHTIRVATIALATVFMSLGTDAWGDDKTAPGASPAAAKPASSKSRRAPSPPLTAPVATQSQTAVAATNPQSQGAPVVTQPQSQVVASSSAGPLAENKEAQAEKQANPNQAVQKHQTNLEALSAAKGRVVVASGDAKQSSRDLGEIIKETKAKQAAEFKDIKGRQKQEITVMKVQQKAEIAKIKARWTEIIKKLKSNTANSKTVAGKIEIIQANAKFNTEIVEKNAEEQIKITNATLGHAKANIKTSSDQQIEILNLQAGLKAPTAAVVSASQPAAATP